MAKHPHRLMLLNKKMWKCMIPGCRYFIHMGLTPTLPGQQTICWNCGEEFTLDEDAIKDAMKDDMIKCTGCRMRASGGPSLEDIVALTETKLALAKAKVKSVNELNPTQRKTMEMMGVKLVDAPTIEEVDEPETHADSCGVWLSGECTCKE